MYVSFNASTSHASVCGSQYLESWSTRQCDGDQRDGAAAAACCHGKHDVWSPTEGCCPFAPRMQVVAGERSCISQPKPWLSYTRGYTIYWGAPWTEPSSSHDRLSNRPNSRPNRRLERPQHRGEISSSSPPVRERCGDPTRFKIRFNATQIMRDNSLGHQMRTNHNRFVAIAALRGVQCTVTVNYKWHLTLSDHNARNRVARWGTLGILLESRAISEIYSRIIGSDAEL